MRWILPNGCHMRQGNQPRGHTNMGVSSQTSLGICMLGTYVYSAYVLHIYVIYGTMMTIGDKGNPQKN